VSSAAPCHCMLLLLYLPKLLLYCFLRLACPRCLRCPAFALPLAVPLPHLPMATRRCLVNCHWLFAVCVVLVAATVRFLRSRGVVVARLPSCSVGLVSATLRACLFGVLRGLCLCSICWVWLWRLFRLHIVWFRLGFFLLRTHPVRVYASRWSLFNIGLVYTEWMNSLYIWITQPV